MWKNFPLDKKGKGEEIFSMGWEKYENFSHRNEKKMGRETFSMGRGLIINKKVVFIKIMIKVFNLYLHGCIYIDMVVLNYQ